MDRTVEVPNGYKIEFEQASHTYKIDGEKVPSVTEITKMVGGPGGLPWWGMKTGVEGVCKLYGDNILDSQGGIDNPESLLWWKDPAAIVGLLTEHKLTVNHIRDKAGDRGTDVHVAAARWAETGEFPGEVPEEQRGYVTAFLAWLEEFQPEPLASEQIVGSKLWGYAGTLDLRCKIGPRTGIVDYKTSTSIRHPQYDYQLAGYELASQECGYGKTDFRAVVRLDKDGTFEWYESPTMPSRFADALGVWYEDKRIKDHKKSLKALRKAAKTNA
jgi:hypothetical protein